MKRSSLHFRVGLVLVAMSAGFAGLVTFILGGGGECTIDYRIAFDENVKGMVVGSKVNFQGVPAGAVTDIRFRDGQSLVEIAVGPDKCVVQDVTRARLDRLLVTGQVTVELEGFERGRGRLPPGSFIQTGQNPIGELTRSLPGVLDSVPGALRRLEEFIANLDATLDADTRRHLQATVANLDAITTRLVPVAERAGEVLDAAHAGAEDLGACSAQLLVLERDLGSLVAEARSVVAGTRGPLLDTLVGMRDAMRDVRGLARLLQLAPSSILYGREVTEPAEPPGGRR